MNCQHDKKFKQRKICISEEDDVVYSTAIFRKTKQAMALIFTMQLRVM